MYANYLRFASEHFLKYLSGATEIAAGSLAAREACDLMGDRRFADIVITDLEAAAPLSDAVLVCYIIS